MSPVVKKDKVRKFPRSGSFKISTVGTINLTADQVAHYFSGQPRGEVRFFVGDEPDTLIIKMQRLTQPLLSGNTTKTRLKFLKKIDTYTPAEWAKRIKNNEIVE